MPIAIPSPADTNTPRHPFWSRFPKLSALVSVQIGANFRTTTDPTMRRDPVSMRPTLTAPAGPGARTFRLTLTRHGTWDMTRPPPPADPAETTIPQTTTPCGPRRVDLRTPQRERNNARTAPSTPRRCNRARQHQNPTQDQHCTCAAPQGPPPPKNANRGKSHPGPTLRPRCPAGPRPAEQNINRIVCCHPSLPLRYERQPLPLPGT